MGKSYKVPPGWRSQSDPKGVDLVAKIMSMGKVHRAYALTGAICTTIAAAIPGTIVRDALSAEAGETGRVRLGHPSGVLVLAPEVIRENGAWRAVRVSSERTARRLMEGFILVPDRLFAPASTVEALAEKLTTP